MKKRIGFITAILLLGLAGCGQKQETQVQKENVAETTEVIPITEMREDENQQELLAILEKNLSIMEKNPKDTAARLEVIRSQIGLKNYDVALVNLSLLMSIDPQIPAIYDYYVQISKEQDKLSLANTAVSKANLYGVQEFLDKIPKDPVFSIKGGSFENKISVEITSQDSDAEIYYRCYGEDMNSSLRLYTAPIDILTGEVRITSYVLKDGIPSNTEEMTYQVGYKGTQVVFQDEVVEQAVRNELETNYGQIPDAITDIDCWRLRNLDLECNGRNINLEDLRWMTNLQNLYIYNSEKITDYNPLKYCKNIDSLNINYGNVTNLDFVKSMPNLQYLNVEHNQIRDISVLKECKNLEYLYIYNNPIKNVEEVLAVNKNLMALEISDSQMTDYSVLTELKNLQMLSIHGLEFDATQVAKLTELSQLILQMDWNKRNATGWDYKQQLPDISFVKEMTKLEYLYLNGISKGEQLQYLHGLKNLENLYLYNSDATKDKEAIRNLKAALPNCNIRY